MSENKYDLNRDVTYGFPAHAPIPEAMLRDGKLPESKTHRHRGSRRSFTHDYCARGYYMITATTLPGAPTLSYIPDIPLEELRKDEMILPELSELGERIETEILDIPKYHPEIKILCSEGRLLMLAPWQENAGRKPESGSKEFHEMNDLSAAIASLPPEERLKLKSK